MQAHTGKEVRPLSATHLQGCTCDAMNVHAMDAHAHEMQMEDAMDSEHAASADVHSSHGVVPHPIVGRPDATAAVRGILDVLSTASKREFTEALMNGEVKTIVLKKTDGTKLRIPVKPSKGPKRQPSTPPRMALNRIDRPVEESHRRAKTKGRFALNALNDLPKLPPIGDAVHQ